MLPRAAKTPRLPRTQRTQFKPRMNTPPTNYDLVAYPSYTHPQTHPDRLAVIGSLFGLQPAPPARCRVLELGCGNGSNLLPMACTLPGSDFTGLDLAGQPVAKGRAAIQELDLKNLRLLHASVMDFDPAGAKFDYIIAHGLFSWVPAPVREQVLKLCRQCLAPHGIAFISYNALPGFHLRNMLREMMCFHVRGTQTPRERIGQAQALVKFLADAQNTRDEYRQWMKSELETILEHEPGHLFHDELADISDPYYFTQFQQLAQSHGLQYLGEADFFEMFDYGFSEATRATLQQLGSNRILREQYLDFLKCRRFRQTLLCHREAPVAADPAARPIPGFFIAASARLQTAGDPGAIPDLRPGVTVRYQTPKGAQCATDYPLGKAALHHLTAEHPPQPFDQLLHHAARTLAAAGLAAEADARDSRDQLAAFLLDLYRAGVVEFRATAPAITRTISSHPAVSPLTRWQIRQGNFVTSQLHIVVKIEDEIGRHLLLSLDGTRDRAGLLDLLWQLLKDKHALNFENDDENSLRRKIENDLDRNLEKLAQLGLLVA